MTFINNLAYNHFIMNKAGTLLSHCLGLMPPEWARRAGLSAMSLVAGLPDSVESRVSLLDHALAVEIPGFGKLAHPIGLGAGFERDGARLRALVPMGLSFAEVGSVRLVPQEPGILTATGDKGGRGIVMGAASRGSSTSLSPGTSWPASADPLDQVVSRLSGPVALNVEIPMRLGPVRAVALVMSALLRLAQGRKPVVVLSWGAVPPGHGAQVAVLEALASEAALMQGLPLWVKLPPGPDRREFQNLVETVADLGYQGIVAGSSRSVAWPEPSLVSGAQALTATNQLLEWAWSVHRGALPMIGSGGVTTGEEAFQKILRGAAAVEVFTALWLRGPLAAHAIRAELLAEVRRSGASSVTECVGAIY